MAMELHSAGGVLSSAEIERLLAKVRATKAVLVERERELLELKGPCSWENCRLHYAHAGPCDADPDKPHQRRAR
jgi:hypothetical protein